MSVVVVHLRWDEVSPEQFERVRQALPSGDDLPAGCFTRTLRLEGTVVHGTEVWADEDAAVRSMADLPTASASAGVEAPMTVVFLLPDVFAAPYRRAATRPSSPERTAAPAQVVPGPRTAEHDDTAEPARQPLDRH